MHAHQRGDRFSPLLLGGIGVVEDGAVLFERFPHQPDLFTCLDAALDRAELEFHLGTDSDTATYLIGLAGFHGEGIVELVQRVFLLQFGFQATFMRTFDVTADKRAATPRGTEGTRPCPSERSAHAHELRPQSWLAQPTRSSGPNGWC